MLPAPVTRLDDAVDRWLDEHKTPALDHIFFALSSAADHSLLWLALGAVRSARSGNPRFLARLAAAQGIESFTTNVLLKSAFRRVRPEGQADGDLPYGLHVPRTSSFPSGHATAAFTAAAFFSEGRTPRERASWYALATMVAASRVYVRMHHTSDVVAGTAIGVAFGSLLRRLLPR